MAGLSEDQIKQLVQSQLDFLGRKDVDPHQQAQIADSLLSLYGPKPGTDAANQNAQAHEVSANAAESRANTTLWNDQMMRGLQAQIADLTNQYHNRQIDANEFDSQLKHLDAQATNAVSAMGHKLSAQTALSSETVPHTISSSMFDTLAGGAMKLGNTGAKAGTPVPETPKPVTMNDALGAAIKAVPQGDTQPSLDDVMHHIATILAPMGNKTAQNILRTSQQKPGSGTAAIASHLAALKGAASAPPASEHNAGDTYDSVVNSGAGVQPAATAAADAPAAPAPAPTAPASTGFSPSSAVTLPSAPSVPGGMFNPLAALMALKEQADQSGGGPDVYQSDPAASLRPIPQSMTQGQ